MNAEYEFEDKDRNIVYLGMFWNGHHFSPDTPHSERFICKRCGAVTSYGAFRLAAPMEDCPHAPVRDE